MNESSLSGAGTGDTGPGEGHSALFAQLVLQQANMAMLLLGKIPHPETGQMTRDLQAAKLFIDQLEMLQVKTKGNLSRQEANLLQQSLTTLRLSFVEAVDTPAPAAAEPSAPRPEATANISPAGSPAIETEEHRKKFSKKY
jgi:Domain of unknown function (DUF1844)